MKFWYKQSKKLVYVAFILLFIPLFSVNASFNNQSLEDDETINELIDNMTPQEKVGQLLLITFDGTNIEKSSAIYDLITNYHIGGVVLEKDNNNFVDEDTIGNTYNLISELQSIEWETSNKNTTDSNNQSHQYIPLFIGISQEGDLYPYDEIISGMTPLPNQLAIGATWKTDYANTIGNILGKELTNVGFNLLLGPSLDVYSSVNIEGVEDMGSRTFGGDPYWVGEMGKAYIEGIHQGGDNQVLVISKHFPGAGESDRSTDQEIPTVRKSLEQLKQIELAPFFAVTGNAPSQAMTTDGILVSHIRYQGFQGNIRATTKPVSFDTVALEQLMAIDAFAGWRQDGGLMISDNLGSDAVRKLYDPTGQSFDARQVARNAFLAGNDVLYLDSFVATGDADEYSTIIRTLDFFTQKYQEDQAFSQKVDASVKRILNKKKGIYQDFDIDHVIPDQNGLENVGTSEDIIFEIARWSATLISPDQEDLKTDLSEPPGLSDRILFITDVMVGRQCENCQSVSNLQVDSLGKAVIKLYGPGAAGQVLQYNISSYSFTDLSRFLDGTIEDSTLPDDLVDADWIVFGLLNPIKERPSSYALKTLLTDKAEIIRNKNVVVFAFNAPYYLDATDISKITAYYGLYSKIPVYVDMAARLLFQEVTPLGSLPVNVSGVGYDLITATSPDPTQKIPLYIDVLAVEEDQTRDTIALSTLEPTNMPLLQVGETLQLRTGIIYDNNQYAVPDGTVVRFIVSSGGDTGVSQQIETVTKNGIGEATYLIQSSGMVEIRAVSEPATDSVVVQINIEGDEPAENGEVQEIIISQTPESTETVTIEATAGEEIPPVIKRVRPNSLDWFLSMVLIWSCGFGIYWIAKKKIAVRWGYRWALLSVIGGTIGFLYLALGLPGSLKYLENTQIPGVLLAVSIGVIFGCLTGYLWWKRTV